MTGPDTPDPDGLQRSLAEAGVACVVVAEGRLAVIRAPSSRDVDWPRVADNAVALARAAGFTHVALELAPDDATPVRRD